MIAKEVKKLRIAKGITRYRLAKEAGIKTATMYALENGASVTLDTLDKVANALNSEVTLVPKKVSSTAEAIAEALGIELIEQDKK